MQIQARFASTCPSCSRPIAVGATVEWSRGSAARHVSCTRGRAATRRPAAAQARGKTSSRQPRRDLADGEIMLQRRSLSADDRYTTGATVRAGKVAGGGGPDGHYWTITLEWRERANEDNGQYDDLAMAYARPATDAEAAPVAARIEGKAARDALERDLAALPGERAHAPGDARWAQLVPRDAAKLCATGTRVAVVDGIVYHERVGDPDMCDSRYHYVVTVAASPEIVARVAAYVEAAS